MIYESTIEIERPIDDVFEVTICMHRCAVWRHMLSSRLDRDGSTQIGSTFMSEYRILGHTYPFKAVITELDRPHTYAFKTIEGIEFSAIYTFTPTEHGTRFHLAAEAKELPAPIRWVLNNRLGKKVIEKAFKQEQKQLKMLLENDVDLWALTPA